jgi:uncharacterized iron-regulated protein
MKKIFLLLFTVLKVASLPAQNNPLAYRLFNAQGKEVNYTDMIDQLAQADIAFFGELHNNSMAHWMELQVTKSLFQKKKSSLFVGMEMFEADNQLQINEYFEGFIRQSNFEKETRLWNNYATDYKPILEFIRENGAKFVATNVPRRYASYVSREGLGGLAEFSGKAKDFMAPMPITFDSTLNCYRKMLEMGDGDIHFPMAQALKDATMAHFILLNHNKGELCLHINGSFHSDNHEGICWYIKKARPEMVMKTITTVSQDSLDKLESEYLNKADFILVVPNDMTPTYPDK